MRGGRLGEPKRLREMRGVEGLSSPGLTKRTSKRLPQRTIMFCFSAAVVHFVQGLSLKTAPQQAEKHRWDNKLSSVAVATRSVQAIQSSCMRSWRLL